MTGWITIVVSGGSGAVVTLVGVVTGGVLASRSQGRHWLRDKQVDACAVVVQQSTTMHGTSVWPEPARRVARGPSPPTARRPPVGAPGISWFC